MSKESVCPKCNEAYVGVGALSRTDNKTEVCPICGQREAVEALLRYYKAVNEAQVALIASALGDN